MIKIAIPVNDNHIAEHFGFCQKFALISIKDNQVITKEFIENPGHKPGFLPKYLQGKGVSLLIAGDIGGGAVTLFKELCIEIIVGAKGEIDTVINQYLQGKLKSTGSICETHSRDSECE